MSATSSASSTSRAGRRPPSTRSSGSWSTTRRPSRPPSAAAALGDPRPGHDAADARPTIVFLHGTVLSGAAWSAQIDALGDAFHCLAPDLPGHGAAVGVPFTIDAAAGRVAALIEGEAHDGRAILVGLSLGGFVAMEVAARWPGRVAGLAISGATADPAGLHALAFQAFATILDVVPGGVLDSVYHWFFERRFPARIAAPIFEAGLAFPGGVVALRALVGERFKPRLAAYPGPSLLINGEYDLFFRPTERSFAAVARNPRRALIRRATHLANLDEPERFSAVIRAFAGRVART